MNGKDLLNQIELNPSQLQYWEVIAKLMQQSLSGAKGYITHNIRNTQGTGIDSIGATIERLKNDGLFVEKVQDNTRAVQTAYSVVDVIEYTTIRVSNHAFSSPKNVGVVTDPEYTTAIGNANTPLCG